MQTLFTELDSETGNRILGQNRIQDTHISVQDTTRFGWRYHDVKTDIVSRLGIGVE